MPGSPPSPTVPSGEASRQLNLWEFYERVLATTTPITDPELARQRCEHLVILAEIVTRWPALQRFLHRRHGTRTGLQLLTAAAGFDNEWPQAVNDVFGGHLFADPVLAGLRQLLLDHEGAKVADLGAQLL